MSLYVLFPLIGFICYIVLTIITLKDNLRRSLNQVFALYLTSLALWQISAFMTRRSATVEEALFWDRLIFMGGLGVSAFFFHFTRAFLDIRGQKVLLYTVYVTGAVFAILTQTDYVVVRMLKNQDTYYPVFGLLFIPYILYSYFFTGYGLFNLIRGYKKTKSGFGRNRIKYPLLGMSITLVATITLAISNILTIPGSFSLERFLPIDIMANIINVSLITYAIVRYRLLDIRVILTKGLIYSFLTGSIVGVYLISVVASERLLKDYFGYTSYLPGIITILILAFTFLPLRNRLQLAIDRLFFREKRDYPKILEQFSRAVTSVLDLKALLSLILKTLTGAIQTNRAFIMLFSERKDAYLIEAAAGITEEKKNGLSFKESDRLVDYLRLERFPLIREEIKMNPRLTKLSAESGGILERHGVALLVPIVTKDRLIGILGLGDKLSGDMYNNDDLRLLTTVVNQSATAIDNATVYLEVERRLSEQTLLFILSETFRKPLELDKTASSLIDVLIHFLNIDYVALSCHRTDGSWEVYASEKLTPDVRGALEAGCSEMAGDLALSTAYDPFAPQIGEFLKEHSNFSSAEKEMVSSSIYLALKQDENILGVLMLPRFIADRSIEQREMELLRAIRAIVSQGLLLHSTVVNLVEMKSYNESILNSMNSGVVVIDTDKRITTINREAERMTGLRSEDVVGHHIYEAEVLHQLSPVVSETMSTEEPIVNREVSIRLADGRKVPLGVSTSILIDAENRTKGVVSIFMDLSQIKQLESQLIRSEKLASVGQLAAGVSHELRNPLGSIFGYAELLNERISSDDEVVKRGLRTILAESERSQHIIESLLDYARMREPSLVTTDLNKVVENTLPLIKHQLSQENVALEVFLEENLPPVQVDEEQMKQVFINLILNAQQAMAGGGRLTISTHQEDGWVKVSFQDAGCGIPEENMGKLFDPFFTTKEYGTGLGLPTVHRIVESHDGLIEVESKVGAGSKFTVSLMASPEDVRSTAESPRGSALQM